MRLHHYSFAALLSIAIPRNAIFLADLEKPSRFSSRAIREQIGSLTDRAEAIADLANDEDRELSDKDKQEIDAILGKGVKGEKGYLPGQVDALEADLVRAKALEQRIEANGKRKDHGSGRTDPQRSDNPQDAPDTKAALPRAASIVIPQGADFTFGSLKCYKGPHARQEAFLVGNFLLATLWDHGPAKTWCKEHGVGLEIHGALSGGSNSGGGYLVPTEMETRIIELTEVYGVFRRNADVTPMMSDTKDQPYVKTFLEATFTGENIELTESDTQWGNAKLVAKKIGALLRFSSELSEDAIISIADALTMQFARAFALKEDNCGFNGDGTSTYGGISGLKTALADGSKHEALAGNVTFDTLDMADFNAVIGKLPEYPGMDPKWYISKPGYANSMERLLDAAGGNTNVTLANGAPQRMFKGYPVEIAQVLPKALTGTESTILVYFGDLRMGVIMGTRRGITIRLSDQRYFEYDQIGIKGTERFDITVHSTGDATETGAVVALETPSS